MYPLHFHLAKKILYEIMLRIPNHGAMPDNDRIDLKLKQLIENIERLESERKEIGDQIAAVYREAMLLGYDAKILRKIVSLRKKDVNERREEEELMETYKESLGMV